MPTPQRSRKTVNHEGLMARGAAWLWVGGLARVCGALRVRSTVWLALCCGGHPRGARWCRTCAPAGGPAGAHPRQRSSLARQPLCAPNRQRAAGHATACVRRRPCRPAGAALSTRSLPIKPRTASRSARPRAAARATGYGSPSCGLRPPGRWRCLHALPWAAATAARPHAPHHPRRRRRGRV
ncbi:MAG: hypothetical protein J3K34DRAFT_416978, partial [Monoraphidium minutum]